MVGFLGKILIAGVAVAGLALGGCAAVMSSCTVGMGATIDRLADTAVVGEIVETLGDGIEQLGTLALVDPQHVDGTLKRSDDGYTGTYRASYTDGSRSCTLFGGTGFERRALKLSYRIEGSAGTARLVLHGADGTRTLAEADAAGTCTIELPSGSNYLRLELKGFAGTVEIAVEEASTEHAAGTTQGAGQAA